MSAVFVWAHGMVTFVAKTPVGVSHCLSVYHDGRFSSATFLRVHDAKDQYGYECAVFVQCSAMQADSAFFALFEDLDARAKASAHLIKRSLDPVRKRGMRIVDTAKPKHRAKSRKGRS